jgi:hypothetical protein
MNFFLLLFSFLLPKPTCSCTPLKPLDEKQYNEYSLITKGKVVNVSVTNFERTIYLEVQAYYKGGGNQRILKILTPIQDGTCGIVPTVGEQWMIYAYTEGKVFRTELCTRTKNMNPKAWDYNKDEIADDIKFLETKMNMKAH